MGTEVMLVKASVHAANAYPSAKEDSQLTLQKQDTSYTVIPTKHGSRTNSYINQKITF